MRSADTTEKQHATSEPSRIWLTLLLGTLAALPSLSIDIGMPGFSVMRQQLDASIAFTGLVVTLFMVGLAVGQLGFGPLSDRIGRRPVLLMGTTLYVLAGAGCAFAGSIETLLAARVVQGIGAGAGTVLSLTIIRDRLDGAAARAMRSYVVAIVSFVPIFAPSLGSWMLEFWGWRMAYAVPAACGAILVAAAAVCFSETKPTPLSNAGARLSDYRPTLLGRCFIGHTLVNASSYAALMSYIAGSSLVFMDAMELSARSYSYLFAATAVSGIAGAWISGRQAKRGISGTALLGTGLVLATMSGLLLVLVPSNNATAWLLLPLLMVNVACRGITGPNAQCAALDLLPQVAGTSAAIISFVQIIAGAAASLAVAVLYQKFGSAAVTRLIAGCSVASLVIWIWATEARGWRSARRWCTKVGRRRARFLITYIVARRVRCRSWARRPIAAETYVSVLHAISWVGFAAVRTPAAEERLEAEFDVAHVYDTLDSAFAQFASQSEDILGHGP